jgi:cell division protein FtsQ
MRGVDGLFRVLDPEGRVLDVIEGQPVALILISGPGTLDLEAGAFAPIGQASAASLVTKLTPTIRPRVESIQVTDDGSDLVMILSPDAVAVDNPFVPPPDPIDVATDPVDPLDPESSTTTTTTTTTVPTRSDGVQTSSIIVRFGSAIGDSEHIEKLVRLEKKLAELPDRNITEINVATNEVTEL